MFEFHGTEDIVLFLKAIEHSKVHNQTQFSFFPFSKGERAKESLAICLTLKSWGGFI